MLLTQEIGIGSSHDTARTIFTHLNLSVGNGEVCTFKRSLFCQILLMTILECTPQFKGYSGICILRHLGNERLWRDQILQVVGQSITLIDLRLNTIVR